MLAALNLALNQTRALQYLQVLGNRVERNGKTPSDIRHSSRLFPELPQNRPPGGIGDRGEDAIE